MTIIWMNKAVGYLLVLILLCKANNPERSVQSSLFHHSLLQRVDDFTSYHLYFETYQKFYVDDSYAQISPSSICPYDEQYNVSDIMLVNHITHSAAQSFRYRQLTNDDVSWHPTNKSSKDTKTTSNDSHVDVVHPYLIVALLLPSHPFSTQILDSLLIAAPMFPVVNIATMNAYKYRVFSGQYDIRFYPKLIFFKDGIKQFIYDGGYSPGAIAETIAKFTESLPSAYPIPRRIKSTSSSNKLTNLSSSSSSSPPSSSPSSLISQILSYLHHHVDNVIITISNIKGLHKLRSLKNQACLEPIAGTFGFACEHEVVILAFSVLYTITRWSYGIYCFVKNLVSATREAA